MDDQNQPSRIKVNPQPSAAQYLIQLGQTGRVESVFSKPVEAHGYTVIQAAEVVSSGGAGYGRGESPGAESPGEGGGGGGVSFGRPVATVIIGPEGVRVEPVFDATKIALTFCSAAAAVLLAMLRIRGIKNP